MTVTVSQNVPLDKFEQFHEILCATGGRYLYKPQHMPNSKQVYVTYEAGDYPEMMERWNRVTTNVVEKTNTNRFVQMFRRLKLMIGV